MKKMEKIKVMRTCEMEVTDIQVGDQIVIPLKVWAYQPKVFKFTATAHKVTDSGVLFIFDDCVATKPMNETATNEGGFEKSDLKKWMDTVLAEAFPDWLKGKITNLSIPTVGEMYGDESEWDIEDFEPDSDEQLPLMKKRRNRITYFGNDIKCVWLRNATKKIPSSTAFALVATNGVLGSYSAAASYGIRPEFWLVK